ncbi:MAG: anti-sigma factor antagonist [Phycisphaerales bacterium]|nr:anti-sigma factor antagonist [Phycisphaerales bacterium]
MALIDWSNDVCIAELSDEPALSDDLKALALRMENAGATGPAIVINLQEVHYLNSTNISQLLRVRKLAIEHKRALCICSVGDQLWGVFLVTGLDKVFQFQSDVSLALACVQLRA